MVTSLAPRLGPLWSGLRFDFGAVRATPGYHFVHEPNESGKTTTMEAVLLLLYTGSGIEKAMRSSISLQVSGVLEIDRHAHGFMRLLGRSGTLVEEAGVAVPVNGPFLGRVFAPVETVETQ